MRGLLKNRKTQFTISGDRRPVKGPSSRVRQRPPCRNRSSKPDKGKPQLATSKATSSNWFQRKARRLVSDKPFHRPPAAIIASAIDARRAPSPSCPQKPARPYPPQILPWIPVAVPGKLGDWPERDPARCELFVVCAKIGRRFPPKNGRRSEIQATLRLKGKNSKRPKKPVTTKMLGPHEEIRAHHHRARQPASARTGFSQDAGKLVYHKIILIDRRRNVDGSAHSATCLLDLLFLHMKELHRAAMSISPPARLSIG